MLCDMNIGRFIVGTSAALAVLAAVGFGFTVFGERPLYLAGDGEITCTPHTTDDLSFGIHLWNDGDSDVTLKAIDFDTLEGLTVTDTWVAISDPQPDGTTLGYGLMPYPPDEDHPSWDDRVPLRNAVIEPGEDISVVIRVALSPGESAHLAGAHVRYTGSGTALGATASSNVQFYVGDPSGCE